MCEFALELVRESGHQTTSRITRNWVVVGLTAAVVAVVIIVGISLVNRDPADPTTPPREISWDQSTIQVPQNHEKFKQQLISGGPLATEERTEISLGDQVITLDHPVIFVRRSVKPISPEIVAELRSGDSIDIATGSDIALTVSASENWHK